MNYQKLANISIIFMGIVLLFFILKEFAGFLRPFFIALILSFLFVPITRISKKKKVLMFINTMTSLLIILIFISIIGTLFLNDSQKITSNNVPNSKLNDLLNKNINIGNYNLNLNSYLNFNDINQNISNIVKNIFTSTTNLFKELFLIILFLIFILPSFDIMKERIEEKLSSINKTKFKSSLTEIEKSIRTYLTIKSLISLGTALISGLIMFFFNVEYYFIFMVLIFILNFIPNIGSFIAVFIILFTYLIFNGFGIGLIFLAILLISTQIIFGNYLEPKIAGKELELSPIIILLSLFFWGYIWGIAGMLFAVPLLSIIKIILSHIESTKEFAKFLS